MAAYSKQAILASVKAKTPSSNNSNEVWSPMGNMNVGDVAYTRLIPFTDELSGGFWTTQKMITLEFVSPEDDSKKWHSYVPCLEMYEPARTVECPVANQARELFKQAEVLKKSGATKEFESINAVALSRWIRYAYLFQGFINRGGKEGFGNPNVLVPIKFPKSVFALIHESTLGETSTMDVLPTGGFDMDAIRQLMSGDLPAGVTEEVFMQQFFGRNYIVKKIKKGEHNNYETSSWDMKETMLEDEQIAYIADNGLLNLMKYLPKRPTDEQYAVYEEMAKVSIDYALGNGDGLWNPEWEDVGIKPVKGKSGEDGVEDSDTGGKSTGAKTGFAARIAARRNEDDSAASDRVNETRAKLMQGRGATKAAETAADTKTTGAEKPNDPVTPKTEAAKAEDAPKVDRMAEMKARLAAKKSAGASA